MSAIKSTVGNFKLVMLNPHSKMETSSFGSFIMLPNLKDLITGNWNFWSKVRAIISFDRTGDAFSC